LCSLWVSKREREEVVGGAGGSRRGRRRRKVDGVAVAGEVTSWSWKEGINKVQRRREE